MVQRLRGWVGGGQRVVGRIPRGRWTNVTLLATLTIDGLGPVAMIFTVAGCPSAPVARGVPPAPPLPGELT